MTTAALKKKIKSLFGRTSHEGKLNRVLDLLSKETKEEAAKRITQEVVEESERSFKEGRGIALDEFEKRTAQKAKRILDRRSRKRAATSRKPTARPSWRSSFHRRQRSA